MVHLRKPQTLSKNHDSLIICVDPISEPLGSRRRLICEHVRKKKRWSKGYIITVPEMSWAVRSTYQTIAL